MNDKIWSRFAPRAPQVSWFEFLLDRTGKLLKDHVKGSNPEPSTLELCGQFLLKSVTQHPASGLAAGNETEASLNERTKHLRFLALVTASYTHWNLEEIQECIPLHLQHLLMTELLKSYGITEDDAKENVKPESMTKRETMVWILYHRWITRCIVKASSNKVKVKPKSRNVIADKNSQDEQINNMLHTFLPHSVKILTKFLTLNEDLEIPFPKSVVGNMAENVEEAPSGLNDESNNVTGLNGSSHVAVPDSHNKSSNVFDEHIPVKSLSVVSHINIDLGALYFIQEDYKMAYDRFGQVFHSSHGDSNLKETKTLQEAKGYYIASAMVCNIPVNMLPDLDETQTLLFKAEKCAVNNLEGLVDILVEDNKRKELSMSYRYDLEQLVLKRQRKDLLFRIMACNAIRMGMSGDLLRPSFLSCLRLINKPEFKFLSKLCADALSLAGSDLKAALNVKRLCETVSQCLSCEFRDLFDSDMDLQGKDKKADLIGKETDHLKIKEPLDVTSLNSSILIPDISGYNFKDDPCHIKREILLSTNAEYLRKLVAQLNLIHPSDGNFVGFECPQYADLLSEILDPNLQSLLHVFITKARFLAVKQNFGLSLSLLSSALDAVNQFSIKAGSTSQTGRVKNILHHEILSTNVQRELYQESSINTDTLRLCKACYHHRDQDPLPSKCIYLNMVSYLLNKKEWQFLIEEGGNFEGITDFLELGYELAAVSVGLSKAGDVVRQHALQLWNTVINIVCDANNTAANPLISYERSSQISRINQVSVTKRDFLTFVGTLKNNTVLSVLASCLTAVLNAMKKDEKMEVKTLYSHIWPTSLEDDQMKIKIDDVLSVLQHLFDRIILLDPCNIPWLKNRADVYFVEGKYRDAMIQYLEVGGMASDIFSTPFPYSVWDEQVFQRMIICSLKQKRFWDVLILCQFVNPIDYTTALKVIQEMGSCGVADTVYDCIWDVTLLEFLTYAHSKRGEVEKKLITIKTTSLSELNSCNSPDTLKQSANQRMSRFLRCLAHSYWS